MDNIEFNKARGTYSMYSAKEKPWHNKGVVADKAQSSSEVIKLANLDFDVVKTQTFTSLNHAHKEAIDKKLLIGNSPMHLNIPIIVPSKTTFSTVRCDNWKILGEVGANYEVVQNREMFEFIDDVVGRGEARFETAGALGQGGVIFMSLKLPDVIRFDNGDDIGENYLLLVSSHDGSKQIDVLFTSVRVVCQNTMNMALKGEAKRRISMKHTKNVRDNLNNLRTLLGIHRVYINTVSEAIGYLNNITVNRVKVNEVIASTLFTKDEMQLVSRNFFSPNGIKEISTKKYNEFNRTKDWIQKGVGQDKYEGTALWVYNGINGYYNNGVDYKSSDDRFESILYGSADKKMNIALNTLLTLN